MKLTQFEALFEQHDSYFLQFDDMPNKLHPRPDLCAFLLLHNLLGDDGQGRDMINAAEHDEIFLDVDCEKLASVITEEQVITLIRCGIRYNASYNSLCMFV